jgi:hypothetical protein
MFEILFHRYGIKYQTQILYARSGSCRESLWSDCGIFHYFPHLLSFAFLQKNILFSSRIAGFCKIG